MLRHLQFSLLILLLSLAPLAHAQRLTVPLVNFDKIPVVSGSGKKLAPADVKAAIARGASLARWIIADAGDGQMVASYAKGRHTASVTIDYTSDTYSINYKESANLKYGIDSYPHDFSNPTINQSATRPQIPLIHPAYNEWVKRLADDIRFELKRL